MTYAPVNSTHVEDIYAIVNELCNDDLHMLAPIKPHQWTFYHAFFFAFTVCSTIGYGNTSPTTSMSKWICMLYALIGMPVNGFLFAGLGEFFGQTVSAVLRLQDTFETRIGRDGENIITTHFPPNTPHSPHETHV